jgi:general transcription factor 3C polypeptide 3 (transcription factor C subunit 4)
MNNYYDEDDMVIDSHEYPDPDLYAPQVPWVRTSGGIFGGHDPNIDPMLYENSGAVDSPREGEEYSDTEEKEENVVDGNDSSVNPDFQEDDDSEQSDLFVSEADSDFDEPTLEDRNNEMEQIQSSRKSRSGAAIDSSYFRARRGRGRGQGGGRGRGRGGKGMKKGIRKPLEPSFEFKQLHSQATTAFLEQNYAAAEDFAKQAIQLNPEIFSIYSLLSEVHMARGDKNRAMHALFNGAHTRPRDTVLWCKVAKMIIEVAGDERQTGIPDAIYCYNRVIGAESSHVEARYERAALHREMGSKKSAAHDYIRLLRYLPHDTAVLRHLAEVFIDLGESTRSIEYYDKSIAHYQSLPPGTDMNFSWSDLNIYAELFMSSIETSMFTTALLKVKSACRWLLGRSEETFWDRYNDDDREFDMLDQPRREEIAEYVANTFAIDTYGEGLPLELRVKLGLFRLRLGEEHFDEAMVSPWGWQLTVIINGYVGTFPLPRARGYRYGWKSV